MSDTIVRPPTIREIYEKIQEQLKECREREDRTAIKDEKWYVTKQTHPDKHIYEILEYIFRPIEESSSITPAEFFTALFNKKNHEEKQGKPGETNKGTN